MNVPGPQVKCENYLPAREGDFGNIHVMVVGSASRNGYTVKDLILQVSPFTVPHRQTDVNELVKEVR